jgi:hypothetical protein
MLLYVEILSSSGRVSSWTTGVYVAPFCVENFFLLKISMIFSYFNRLSRTFFRIKSIFSLKLFKFMEG